jgi:HEPN domain-containing protein
MPSDPDSKLHYRSAFQRLDEARFLLDGGMMGAGAVYLAGYAVECILKALILSRVPKKQRKVMFAQLRGSKAHDFEWLRGEYRRLGGDQIPAEIARRFSDLAYWSTELRYSPRQIRIAEATQFLESATRIVDWADGRL